MIYGSAGGAYDAQRTHHHHGVPLGQRSKKRWLMLLVNNTSNSAVHHRAGVAKKGALRFWLGALCLSALCLGQGLLSD